MQQSPPAPDPSTKARRTVLRPGRWLLGLFLILGVRPARAEDAISYKYQDYAEAGGRIAVQVHSALIEKNLGPLMRLKVQGVIDTIAGATPTGQPPATPGGSVPLAQLEEERKAWNVDFSRQFSRVNLSAGVAQSRESDYVSRGWSLNLLADFNQKNTTLLLGAAGTSDEVRVFFQSASADKRTSDLIVGVTQLLDPQTSVTFNVSFGRASGYLSDPYKIIQKNVEIVPGVFLRRTFNENRPDRRDKWLALALLNRAFPSLHGAVEASYRHHRDDFGITSHTVTVEWFQKLGAKFILRPSIRYFGQGAADFYHVTLDGTPITPTAIPTGRGPHYSSDYRLSDLRTLNYGLKAVWRATDSLLLDAAIERYEMHGRDGRTSASAYPRATIFTAGVRYSF